MLFWMMKRNGFVSRVMQRELPPDSFVIPETETPRDETVPMVPVLFRFFKISERGSRRWIAAATSGSYNAQLVLVGQVGYLFSLDEIRSGKAGFSDYVAQRLTELNVPTYAQPDILGNLAEVVDTAVPDVPICVAILDATSRTSTEVSILLSCSITSMAYLLHKILTIPYGRAAIPLAGFMTCLLGRLSTSRVDIDRDTWELLMRVTGTGVPATKESIESLEYLGLGDLEEDAIRQACVICLEQLDDSDNDLQIEMIDDHSRVLARLPCRHLYHKTCIVRWLKKNQICPLCQSPLEIRKPPKIVWTHNLPMRYMFSAGSVLTAAMLICKYWKRAL